MDAIEQALIAEDTVIDEISEDQIGRISSTIRKSFSGESNSQIPEGQIEIMPQLSRQNSLAFDEKLHIELLIDGNMNQLVSLFGHIAHLMFTWKDCHKNKEQFQKPVLEVLQKCKKIAMLRELQLDMVLFIINNAHKPSFEALYSACYEGITSLVVPLADCHQKINVFVLEELLNKERIVLNLMMEDLMALDTISENYHLSGQVSPNKEREIIIKLNRLRVENSKQMTITEVFPYACVKDSQDLFSVPRYDKRWQRLFGEGWIAHKIYGEPDKINRSFDEIREKLNIVNASMSILSKQNKEVTAIKGFKDIGKIIDAQFRILKCAVSKEEAQREAETMISQPSDRLAKDIWNLPEQKNLRSIVQLSFPSIEYSEQLQIPRKFKQYFETRYWGKKPSAYPDLQINHATSYGNSLYGPPSLDRVQIRINCKNRIARRYYTLTEQELKGQAKNAVMDKLNEVGKNVEGVFSKMTNFFKKDASKTRDVIFHIHGGGFISMSSFAHQTYTRVWANELNIPVVSVDYGKAPQYPFPEGLYDCLEAYLWTVECFSQIYEVQPQRIILVGDSAGGNLVAALTTLLIQWGLRKPDGIVLVYPALNLNIQTYTPSFLTALNDMILPHTFLKICLRAYLQDPRIKPETDPFASPILTANGTLAQYPPTRIFVGNKDPFHDDCCRLAERLNNLKPGLGKLLVIDQFPHGFLQFHTQIMRNEGCRLAINEVQMALAELLKIPS